MKRKIRITLLLIAFVSVMGLWWMLFAGYNFSWKSIFPTSESTPAPTESIWNLESYNREANNISSLVTISGIQVTSASPSANDFHVMVTNNSRWSIQMVKVVLGDEDPGLDEERRKYLYGTSSWCMLGGYPDTHLSGDFPDAPGFESRSEVYGQGANSVADYECQLLKVGFQSEITPDSKICFVFYPLSKYSLEKFNYIYREHFYLDDPEWRKAYEEFNFVTICNK